MRTITTTFAAMLLLFITACGYHEGVLQRDEVSYLTFSGNRQNTTVHVDGRAPMDLQNPAEKTLYKVAPGRYGIKIYRDGNLVVDRILILDNGVTTEVIIP